MICPRCGNNVSQEEVFCGQCGVPNTSQLPTPAENNFPSAASMQHNQPAEPSGTFNTHSGMASSQFGVPGQLPPRPQTSLLSENSSLVQRVPPRPARRTNQLGQYTPQQQGSFYRDATEAMSPLPGNAGQDYVSQPQQNLPGIRTLGNYASPSPYVPQSPPSQGGQYSAPGYSQQPFVTGQHYHQGTRIQLPPSSPLKQQSNPVILIVSICSIVVFLGAIVLGGVFLTKNNGSQTHNTPLAARATRASTPKYTPTPIPSPSPTAVSTPSPDPGFAWCGQPCATSTFNTEYPATWQVGTILTTNAIQFANPAQPDQYAIFKSQGLTSSDAGILASDDLQTSYSTQPGYIAPPSTSVATISGETWIKDIAYYQGASQQEEVEVFATVHDNKAYVLDLNAPTSQFVTINGQAFVYILSKFQFLVA